MLELLSEEAMEAERARQDKRRELLQREVEIETLQQQLETLRRKRNAGVTPGASLLGDADNDDASSILLQARDS